MNGIKEGFNLIDDDTTPIPAMCDNYISATDDSIRDIVEKQIIEEVNNGRYEIVHKRPTIVSALGAIPKPNGREVRLIHDCSRPVGTSLNDFASKESVKYQTLEEAVALTASHSYFAKIDLKSAYRSVKIHPSNHDLTGLKWVFQGSDSPSYLIDHRLPFGARKSPAIFHRLTQGVRRMMERRGYGGVIVYLDDF